MKKIFAITLALCLLLAAVCSVSAMSAAKAEEEAPGIFADLADQVFYFSSGVGGWFTELKFAEDGSFTGSFHDSEMGEMGEGYPMGTVYGVLFHGSCSDPEQLSDYVWRIRVDELEPDEGQVPEYIEDGIRYVTSESIYGLDGAEELLVYLPGMPVNELPEGYYIWSHLTFQDPQPEKLPFWGIYYEAEECGFVGDYYGESEEAVG